MVAIETLERALTFAAGRQRQGQEGPAFGASRSFGLAHAIFNERQLIIVLSGARQKQLKFSIGFWNFFEQVTAKIKLGHCDFD